MKKHGLRALGLALLVSAVTAGPAAAGAFPGPNGPIAYEHGTVGSVQLYVANPDGSGAHAITNPPSGYFDNNPRFSADAQWVVFGRDGFPSGSSSGGTAEHVMLARADGSCLTDLSQTLAGRPLSDVGPSFSPDGTYVVFSRYDNNTDTYVGIYRENVTLTCTGGSATSGTPIQLTNGPDYWPQISADGTRLAFARDLPSSSAIFVAPVANPAAAQQVTNPPADSFDNSPGFSPDGSRIVFSRDLSIDVTNSDGSGSPTVLVPQSTGTINRSPAFSPDGSRVVFMRSTGVGPGGSPAWGIYTVSSSGGSPTVVPGLGGNSSMANQDPDWGVGTRTPPPPPPTYLKSGSFVVGDGNAKPGTSVTWWGAQWWKANTLSGGSAPAAFKGFADQTNTNPPTCGGTWTTRPGNSSKPPASVPSEMAVIVTRGVRKSGSSISGTIAHIVVVKTNGGYAPNPGHAGTGTVTRVVC